MRKVTPSKKCEERAYRNATLVISRTFRQEPYVQSWKRLVVMCAFSVALV